MSRDFGLRCSLKDDREIAPPVYIFTCFYIPIFYINIRGNAGQLGSEQI